MGKRVYILNCPSGSAGVAKIISNSNKSHLTISLNKRFPEIKKCHLLNNEKIIKTFEMKKNKNSFEFINDSNIEKIYLTGENNDNIVVWSGELPEKKESEIYEDKVPDFFTFDNFFGGGFEWHRIRGNFIMYNYSIIHYVISDDEVYRAINKAGYYTCGVKKENNITFIAIAIPIKENENPYLNLNIDNYMIKSGKTFFCTICAGIDETGEFFVSI